MTVSEGKATIVKVLEELQRQGVWIRRIEIVWRTAVEGDQAKPNSKTECSIKLEADL